MVPGQEIWLVRHGETEWSATGRHTGRTDLPLTARGIELASRIRPALAIHEFAQVLSSPLQRATETARLAGFDEISGVDPNLREWDYGIWEGRTTAEVRQSIPDWSIWTTDVPEGETLDDVGRRADAVIDRVLSATGDVLLFAHGHMLRILAARWLGLPAEGGRLFALGTAGLSILGFERETRVIQVWNRSLGIVSK
ncbi:MAG: histidine phosphatase family protein [Bryobacteraceae bacterium]|nr:histidine phosphatase family protein [Bryobacteraceae bacterium]